MTVAGSFRAEMQQEAVAIQRGALAAIREQAAETLSQARAVVSAGLTARAARTIRSRIYADTPAPRASAGLRQLDAAVATSRTGLGGLSATMATFRSAAGALGVGLSLSAFTSATKATFAWADALKEASERVGIGVEQMQRLQRAGELTNVSQEQITGNLHAPPRRRRPRHRRAGQGPGGEQHRPAEPGWWSPISLGGLRGLRPAHRQRRDRARGAEPRCRRLRALWRRLRHDPPGNGESAARFRRPDRAAG